MNLFVKESIHFVPKAATVLLLALWTVNEINPQPLELVGVTCIVILCKGNLANKRFTESEGKKLASSLS